jgi:hypothetical protein
MLFFIIILSTILFITCVNFNELVYINLSNKIDQECVDNINPKRINCQERYDRYIEFWTKTKKDLNYYCISIFNNINSDDLEECIEESKVYEILDMKCLNLEHLIDEYIEQQCNKLMYDVLKIMN